MAEASSAVCSFWLFFLGDRDALFFLFLLEADLDLGVCVAGASLDLPGVSTVTGGTGSWLLSML
jgi:hypothetical protein